MVKRARDQDKQYGKDIVGTARDSNREAWPEFVEGICLNGDGVGVL